LKAYACLTKQGVCDGKYAIVPVQPEHIESIRQWRNAQLDVLRQTMPISQQQQVDYYTKHIWPSMSELMPANIVVSYLCEGIPIGYGGLVHIAWQDLRAEVSFLLASERTTDAAIYSEDFRRFLGLIKQLAFDRLNFHRLFTETYSIRQLHIATLEQSGFILEGVMREHVRIGGLPVDSIIHGCLKKYER
jgi:RimJ/RimL family protein N-acetyltransferase